MLVTIVAIANADNTGLDLDRLEKVEDLPAEVARKMLDIGTAREPSDSELEKYHAAQAETAERNLAEGADAKVAAEDALNQARADAMAQNRETANALEQAKTDFAATRPPKKNAAPAVEQGADAAPPSDAPSTDASA